MSVMSSKFALLGRILLATMAIKAIDNPAVMPSPVSIAVIFVLTGRRWTVTNLEEGHRSSR